MRAIGVLPPPIRVNPSKAKDFTVTGFAGMYDSKAKGGEAPGEAPLLINLMPGDVTRPSQVTLRSGLTRLGTATTVQLGSGTGATRAAQWIGIGLTIGGTARDPLVWCNGELYEIGNLLTGAFVKVVSAANLTTAGITIAGTGTPIHAVVFNGQIVFSPASSRPFMWNGASGAGGLTSLTNAPLSIGASPAVYYGKLFFVSTTTEIQWSEENQPNVGYTTGGYNNAWGLTETGTSRLLGLIGTNEGLYYARTDRIGVIRGAVNSTFSTDGVRESVSPSGGVNATTPGPAMIYANGTLFWFDADYRPWAWRAGTGVVPLWKQLPRQFVQESRYTAEDKQTLYVVGEEGLATLLFHNIVYDATRDRVWYNGARLSDAARISLVFDVGSLRPLCWQTWTASNHPPTAPSLWIAQGLTATQTSNIEMVVDFNGYVFYRVLSVGTGGLTQYWDHNENSDGAPYIGVIVGPMHGWTGRMVEWQFDRLNVVVDAMPAQIVSAALLTSRNPTTAFLNFQASTDIGLNPPSERSVAFGFNQGGGWGRVVAGVLASEANTVHRPAIHGWTLRGYARGAAPTMP